MSSTQFEALELSEPLLRALAKEGYEQPTPIQEQAIPQVLAGKDLLATAQTGTGKTAAFSLPMLQVLNGQKGRGQIRALILTPTRELALQIDESFRNYGHYLSLTSTVILGGVPVGAQVRALRKKPDILVATPGRLLDLMNQRHVKLDQVEILVLDEADRMVGACADAGVPLVCGAISTNHPSFAVAKGLVAEGAIGELVTARVQLFFPPMPAYYGGDRPWRMDREAAGGGLSIDTGSHYIRPLRTWLGEIDEVVERMIGEDQFKDLAAPYSPG